MWKVLRRKPAARTHPFKPGDIVVMKTGSPKLYVFDVSHDKIFATMWTGVPDSIGCIDNFTILGSACEYANPPIQSLDNAA